MCARLVGDVGSEPLLASKDFETTIILFWHQRRIIKRPELVPNLVFILVEAHEYFFCKISIWDTSNYQNNF